eukprot:7377672-Prymnesium_polylepis.3
MSDSLALCEAPIARTPQASSAPALLRISQMMHRSFRYRDIFRRATAYLLPLPFLRVQDVSAIRKLLLLEEVEAGRPVGLLAACQTPVKHKRSRCLFRVFGLHMLASYTARPPASL